MIVINYFENTDDIFIKEKKYNVATIEDAIKEFTKKVKGHIYYVQDKRLNYFK